MVTTSYTTKYPNESDHNFLYTAFNNENIKYGPGIVRCNSTLTENHDYKTVIEHDIETMIGFEDGSDIFTKWDKIKMKIRKILKIILNEKTKI